MFKRVHFVQMLDVSLADSNSRQQFKRVHFVQMLDVSLADSNVQESAFCSDVGCFTNR